MTIQTIWDTDDHTAIRITLDRQWTWDEMYVELDIVRTLLDTVDQGTVPLIFDARTCEEFPRDILNQVPRLKRMATPRVGALVFVGLPKSPFMMFSRSMVGIVRRVFDVRRRIEFVSTLEEARALPGVTAV